MNNPILVTHNVVKAYHNGAKEVRAVDGIDISIRQGRSMAVLGQSGAGKSTLLHLLGCLDRPTSGSVLLDGLDVYSFSDKERSRIRNTRIGFIFQFYHLLPEFTALENVMLPAMIKGPGPRTADSGTAAKGQGVRERAREILRNVGLEHRLTHRPGELSGGESQRVAIARALINGPEVLLCDEPTGNLDSKTSESIYELLFDVKTRSNTALVFVTHDERVALRTDDVVRLKDGKVR